MMDIDFNEEKFKEIINSLDEKIKKLSNVYGELNKGTEILNGTNDAWNGQTQESYYDYYKEVSSEFPGIIAGFEKYSKFLKMTLENYKNNEKQSNKNIENNSENFDVN